MGTLISIHAPARGATSSVYERWLARLYFNPRSRTGSDISDLSRYCFLFISIHAPARGATVDNADPFQYLGISIHAPARGATLYARLNLREILNFNPRSRTGSDIVIPNRNAALEHISIHAPARGATRLPHLAGNKGSYFNPRTRTGSDRFAVCAHGFIPEFQSTLPHGERLRYRLAHEHLQKISIHAPAWGATN